MTTHGAIRLGRQVLFVSGSSTITYGIYKSKTDPLHIVWDLDHTLICSVTPIPSNTPTATMTTQQSHPLYYFDQIDDDFPYTENIPNTRTYIRPGAKTALWFTGLFAINHVYTAAQESYTNNVLNELDPHRTIFQTVIHRDLVPHHDHDSTKAKFVGKDLRLTLLKHSHDVHQESNQEKKGDINMNDYSDSAANLGTVCTNRILLFDDRIRNFTPQPRNGIHVQPFEEKHVLRHYDNQKNYCLSMIAEWKELTRLCLASAMCMLSSDVCSVLQLSWFRSKEHNRKFPMKLIAKTTKTTLFNEKP